MSGDIEEAPDATLEALKQRLGVSGSIMIVCLALQKLGLPLKTKAPHASERDTPEVQKKRRSSRRCVRASRSDHSMAGRGFRGEGIGREDRVEHDQRLGLAVENLINRHVLPIA